MNTDAHEGTIRLHGSTADETTGLGLAPPLHHHERSQRREERSHARVVPSPSSPLSVAHGPQHFAAPSAFLADPQSTAATPALASGRQTTKRALDIVFAFLGLVITAPLMLLLAIIIRLDSKGSPLLRQTRIGRDGRPFELIKLRSMVAGANVTRVGRLIRPLGLDELPQLWNVLHGDMSIVGPRPERPHLVAHYEAHLAGYGGRHVVRPGITGWAQIHGLRGGERPISERLRFDLEYVRAQSLGKDLRILALTFSAVWRDTRRELRL